MTGDPGAMRPPLERHAGRGRQLFFDCPSGIAGDMTVGALVDLGVPFRVVSDALEQLPMEGYRLQSRAVEDRGIGATAFEVHVDEAQPPRSFAAIDAMLREAAIDDGVRERARAIFRRLAEAEARVHRVAVDEVHFHEVGAVDSIADIVGASAALEYLGAEVLASPLPMGRGWVEAAHGSLPLPAPAAIECLQGVPTYPVEIDAELVTPTGAAIVGATAVRFARWPCFAPERVGYGAGERQLPDRPNLLRVVLGSAEHGAPGLDATTHVVLEANVDDMTGEIAAHAVGELMTAGAVDAWAAPITMKKGRPGLTISALVPAGLSEAVAQVMLRETTTIGLRRTAVSRLERPRRMVEVSTRFGPIAVKLSEGTPPPQLKPEFDACLAAARRHDVPVRVVLLEALAAARDLVD